ncbi:hypothetical protein [Mycolicibacterium neoaurum]|uniref:Secreted protein n=1 Tax=Mycolicibacterium neoaurum TaxID=1795 RepID=A0AAV2WPK1_MYCNE|nr:hypothetical protein [Mycolicibacterium neoaurum]TLH58711.1 hypothetical protein C1S81_11315 [Mycolicibacterium neoaurum]CDQ46241.1 hypothetical protein BN1047_04146 [Mycolicibacterium neoaurum]
MRLLKMLIVPALIGAGLSATPSPHAGADCTSAGGTTICSQGDVRGSNSGDGPSGSSGPYVPYACDLDWYACDDYYWGIDVDFVPGVGRPGVPVDPGFGRPGGGNVGGGNRGGRR